MVTTNQKSVIFTTQKREGGLDITLKTVIKSQGKITKEEERNKKEIQKERIIKIFMHLNNFLG